MPPKPPEANPWEPVLLLVGFLALMLGLLWARGGLSAIQSGSQGLFLQSPVTTPTSPGDTSATQTNTSPATTNNQQ